VSRRGWAPCSALLPACRSQLIAAGAAGWNSGSHSLANEGEGTHARGAIAAADRHEKFQERPGERGMNRSSGGGGGGDEVSLAELSRKVERVARWMGSRVMNRPQDMGEAGARRGGGGD